VEEGAALLEGEGLLRFRTSDRWVALRTVTDASGQPLWSMNVVVGDEGQLYAESDTPRLPYPRDDLRTGC
jgi:hypothetical protein